MVRAMGSATKGKNVVLKLQSGLTPFADLFQRAFPDTPFVFLYRNPVEVMASNLMSVRAGGARHHPSTATCVLFTP